MRLALAVVHCDFNGQDEHSKAIVKTPDMELARLSFPAGGEFPNHKPESVNSFLNHLIDSEYCISPLH